jgi:cell division protein FtsI/penicillin-binding protein 2
MPMGHEIAVTPLQSVCSMSVIANGGKLMVPQLIREVTDDEGHTVETMQPQVVRDVLRKQTVDVVQAALGSVVSKDGTARLAAVKGFKVAGKTGTAQVYNSDGSICHDRHRVSFVGYMPADAPEFACIVMLEQPITAPNQDMGGLVAAPIFSRIAERTARYMGLQPEPEPVLTAQAGNSKPRQP